MPSISSVTKVPKPLLYLSLCCGRFFFWRGGLFLLQWEEGVCLFSGKYTLILFNTSFFLLLSFLLPFLATSSLEIEALLSGLSPKSQITSYPQFKLRGPRNKNNEANIHTYHMYREPHRRPAYGISHPGIYTFIGTRG